MCRPDGSKRREYDGRQNSWLPEAHGVLSSTEISDLATIDPILHLPHPWRGGGPPTTFLRHFRVPPSFRPNGVVSTSPISRSARAALRSAGASVQTGNASDDSRPTATRTNGTRKPSTDIENHCATGGSKG